MKPTKPLLPLAVLCLLGCIGQPVDQEINHELETLQKEPWGDPHKVIAEVNGRPITRGGYYQRVLDQLGTRTVLSSIIKEELFFQEAERLRIAIAEEEVKARVEEKLKSEASEVGGLDPMANLQKIYENQGLSLDDVREDYARIIRKHLLIGKVVKAMRVVDDQALRKYYQETFFKTRYRVGVIAYAYRADPGPASAVEQKKLQVMGRALEALKRLRDGADFAEIARGESMDEASRRRGGDMGYVSADDPLHPTIKEAVFKLKPGETSEPVDFPEVGSISLFRVSEIVLQKSFSECQAALRQELVEREPDLKEIEETLELLRTRANIRYFGHPAKGVQN
ncbi:MAG: peptidylprolyl isomerase [Planctomycetes bacterium]|nr:peptidylprolyl isomerase [Planctomycetota bacterium]